MPKIIFDLPLFRSSDPDTSRQVSPMRTGSHRAILLAIYADATLGLTDEEAATRALAQGHEIRGYWKRCSDLRTAGLIHDLGIRRALSSGSQGIVCCITQAGLDMVRGWA
jgi:hypothetical protein